jgi:exodeoxyribonuclease VII large subunit
VILAPTAVQGEEAPAGIVKAIQVLNQLANPDIILLARGGGSIEDLWAFNNEMVARAIASSTAPVICGIGHETDFTIADFVCDLRAPTPTAAAEMAVPNLSDLQSTLNEVVEKINRYSKQIIASKVWRLKNSQDQLAMRSPALRLRSDRQRLDEIQHRLEIATRHLLLVENTRLAGFSQKLGSLNPISILRRGFAIVSHKDGRLVLSIHEVSPGQYFNVQVSDGSFAVQALQPDAEIS